jgi:hypothetical protein
VKSGSIAYRLEEGTLLLEGPGVFVHADGKMKSEYSSCCFSIWAATPARAEEIGAQLFHLVERPGRCFATLHTRSLTPTEGSRLIARLCGGELERELSAFARTFPPGTKACSVASIYRACGSVSA